MGSQTVRHDLVTQQHFGGFSDCKSYTYSLFKIGKYQKKIRKQNPSETIIIYILTYLMSLIANTLKTIEIVQKTVLNMIHILKWTC